jgi:hypothetical protein
MNRRTFIKGLAVAPIAAAAAVIPASSAPAAPVATVPILDEFTTGLYLLWGRSPITGLCGCRRVYYTSVDGRRFTAREGKWRHGQEALEHARIVGVSPPEQFWAAYPELDTRLTSIRL